MTGDLTAPPEFATFSYKDFLARQSIYSMIDRPRVSIVVRDQGSPIPAAIFAFKARVNKVITPILPAPQASLLTGILLGNEACGADIPYSGLPSCANHTVVTTGTIRCQIDELLFMQLRERIRIHKLSNRLAKVTMLRLWMKAAVQLLAGVSARVTDGSLRVNPESPSVKIHSPSVNSRLSESQPCPCATIRETIIIDQLV